MTASSTSTSSASADYAAGAKVITYAFNLMVWGTALATAWACSTFLMGLIMFIITAIVMSILRYVLGLVVFFKVDASSIENLGRTATSVTTRVTSTFTRTPAPTPVAV